MARFSKFKNCRAFEYRTYSTCESNTCVCPPSHNGNGIACDALTESCVDIARTTVIPIRTIGAMGPGTSVILQYSESNWLLCIDHLRFHGVDVFVTINAVIDSLLDF